MEWAAIFGWALAIAILSAMGAPIASAIFDRLADKGAPFAPHLALVLIGIVSFWVGHVRYGWVAIGAGLMVVAACSLLAYYRGYRPRWPSVLEGYVVFLVGFALTIAIRVPDNTIRAAGGEQFLHYGLLNAVGRADRLPPEDMWFAGESVNYYYGGHVLVDQLARLTWTEPRLAYNLGLAVIFGLTAAAAYGLVGSVVERYGYRRRIGGVVGVATLLLAGTLTTPARVFFAKLSESIGPVMGGFAYAGIPSEDPIEEIMTGYTSFSEWSWWFERRVVDGTLVETPLYSMLKADLHGHVTTIPFMVVLIAVAFAYWVTPEEQRWRRLAIIFGAFPVVGAMVGWMNTWSLPGAVGIAWLALALSPADPLSMVHQRFMTPLEPVSYQAWLVAEGRRLVAATVGAVGVGLIAAALIAPFLLFQLPTNEGIGFLPDRSPFAEHFLLFGAFFVLIGLFLLVAIWRRAETAEMTRHGMAAIVIAVLVMVAIGLAGFGSIAIGSVLLVIAWMLVRRRPSIGFIALLIAGTLGLILVMELMYANVWPPERQRLNTTYKLSMQAMVFGLLATGTIATVLLSDRLTELRTRLTPSNVGTIGIVLLVLVLLATFPVLALGGQFSDYQDPHPHMYSIDALDGHERWNSEQLEAIHWLDERAGNPVILEAPGDMTYTFVNPASSFTGLPSVVGWAHQQGYRGISAYEERRDHVDTIYTGEPLDVVPLLASYEVEYIWVGDQERSRYGTAVNAFEAFDEINVAFENSEVTIYHVERDLLEHPDG